MQLLSEDVSMRVSDPLGILMRAFLHDTTRRWRVVEAFTWFSTTGRVMETDFMETVKAVSALRLDDAVAQVMGGHVRQTSLYYKRREDWATYGT